jgi:hypothetical protein
LTDDLCPEITQYVQGSELEEMEGDEWNIELKFDDVKKMFDSVVDKILDAINEHLERVQDIKRNLTTSYLQKMLNIMSINIMTMSGYKCL